MKPESVRRGPRASDRLLIAVLLLFGAVLVGQLVIELAAPPGTTGHHDFLAFWSAGRLILDGRPADLYDASALTAIQRAVIPVPIGMNGYMPFINPPAAAVAMAPLAALPEPSARVVWAVLNAILVVGAAAWVTRGMTRTQRLVGVALIVTSYPVFHALAEGQWSILLLAAGLVALEAARRGAWVVSGAALGIMWVKPQFIALPLVALLAGRRWTPSSSAGLVGLGAALTALPLTGLGPNLTYAGYLLGVVTSHFAGAGASGAAVWRGDLATTEGINGLLVGWFGQGQPGLVTALWAVAVLVLGGIYLLALRSHRPGLAAPRARVLLAAGIVFVLLVNPNQFVQDCVLLFLILDALAPLPTDRRFMLTGLTVAVADLTYLDLHASALHLFPMVLLVAFVVACRPEVIPSRFRNSLGVP